MLRRHPLIRADISEAVNWYENQQPGLGLDFGADFLSHYHRLARDAQLYAVRFADVRRLNLDRFPYGIFYVIRPPEIWLLAVLHASRDTETVLAERRCHFRG
ncbi:MAG: type II toxin-antitoxin system RelE/ParE family toxin [Verrucomicrobiota bacterium]